MPPDFNILVQWPRILENKRFYESLWCKFQMIIQRKTKYTKNIIRAKYTTKIKITEWQSTWITKPIIINKNDISTVVTLRKVVLFLIPDLLLFRNKNKTQWCAICNTYQSMHTRSNGRCQYLTQMNKYFSVSHASSLIAILAWCRIYASWKTALISLVTLVCVANPSNSLIGPGGDLQNSVRPREF